MWLNDTPYNNGVLKGQASQFVTAACTWMFRLGGVETSRFMPGCFDSSPAKKIAGDCKPAIFFIRNADSAHIIKEEEMQSPFLYYTF